MLSVLMYSHPIVNKMGLKGGFKLVKQSRGLASSSSDQYKEFLEALGVFLEYCRGIFIKGVKGSELRECATKLLELLDPLDDFLSDLILNQLVAEGLSGEDYELLCEISNSISSILENPDSMEGMLQQYEKSFPDKIFFDGFLSELDIERASE